MKEYPSRIFLRILNEINVTYLAMFPKLPERVVVVIIGGFKLDEHEIDRSDGGRQEEDLHGRVVQ